MRALLVIVLCLVLTSCGAEAPLPSTGYLPADAFGNSIIGESPTIATLNTATAAFADPKQMQGQPARMALAIASLDAIAGQFSTAGQWAGVDPIAQMLLLEARGKVRSILGVPEAAPSQSVIDHLVDASHALDAGNQNAAITALSGPDFTLPPAQTLALLTHFPKVPIANQATMYASQYLYPRDDDGGRF